MDTNSETKILRFPSRKVRERINKQGEKLVGWFDEIDDNLDYVKSICSLCFAYAESPSNMEPDVILAVMLDAERRIGRVEEDFDHIRKICFSQKERKS